MYCPVNMQGAKSSDHYYSITTVIHVITIIIISIITITIIMNIINKFTPAALSHKWNLSEAGRLPAAATINPPRPGADELPSEAYGMDRQNN